MDLLKSDFLALQDRISMHSGVYSNVGRFGHGRFGLGRFGLGRFGHGRFGSAIFEGGRFGQIYFWIRFSMIKHANNTTVITFIVQPLPHFITII